MMKNLSYSHRK